MLRVRDGIQAVVAGLLVAGALVLLGCPQDDPGPGTQTVATPTANPSAGTYSPTITVSLSCATSGASIHYTLDGSNPTTNSTLYNSPIAISTTTTLKAIAVKDGMNNSAILTATYTINTGNPQPQTVATPVANPNGGTYTEAQSVTLSCSTSGASIYYTIDGSNPTINSTLYFNAITINENTTLKAIAVKSGMNNSAVMSETYTIGNAVQTIDNIILGTGVTGKLEILTTGNALLTISNYTDPATLVAITINNQDAKSALNDKNVEVHIVNNNGGTVSLAYVHYLRQALLGAVGAGKSVIINSNLTPVFDGMDWWDHSLGAEKNNLYKVYLTDIDIMNGIKISKNSPNGKYVIEYNREIKVTRLVWQDNDRSITTPFYGFGLSKGQNYNGQPLGDNVLVFGGFVNEEDTDNANNYYPTANWADYEYALKYAGLHPFNSVRLDHSRVWLSTDPTANTNVMTNGAYDFILAYYNPKSDGTVDGINNQARLPKWPSGMSLDGRYWPNNVDGTNTDNGFSRNIGGVTANNPHRKGTDGVSGAPNNNFVGNITVAMANFMRTTLNISEFKNTNILGNSDQWTVGNGVVVSGNTLTLTFINNIGLIGDYSVNNLQQLSLAGNGVVDIQGNTPELMVNNGSSLYLNLWTNVLRETNVTNFPVVFVRNAGIGNIKTGGADMLGKARVIISGKYNSSDLIALAKNLKPYYRAFPDGNTIKITPAANSAFRTAYPDHVGYDTSGNEQIPSLDEVAWLNGTQTFTSYNSFINKWTQSEFASFLVATPPHIDTWLADMPHALLEAVLDNRRRVYGGRG